MLTVAQRRSISARTIADPGFRARLASDPLAALAEVLGTRLPGGEAIEVLEETASRWAFVLPNIEDIEAELPVPTDARSAVENQIYAALRAEPEMIDVAARDPRGFLLEKFGVEVKGVDLRRERPGTTVVVVPHEGAREELSDDMLDLVAGGGNQPMEHPDAGSIKTL